MLNKLFIVLIFPLLFLACNPQVIYIDGDIEFSINSPKAGWVYYDDMKVMLSVNVNTQDISWSSDIAGYLGRGNHLAMFLPQGLHNIIADIKGVKRDINVYIAPDDSSSKTVLVNYSPLEVKTKVGNIFPYLFTHNGTVNDFRIRQMQDYGRSLQVYPQAAGLMADGQKRDFRLPMPKAGKPPAGAGQRTLSRASYSVGDKRFFYVVNTTNQTGMPHNKEAELIHQSSVLSVWLFDSASSVGLTECIQKIESIIVPRVEAVWGKAADIDGDGRIALLFSETLNEENIATGFFNPSDFFARNDDVVSDSYNPYSNEMDIIYAAMPAAEQNSPFYIDGIVATIAHELAHASTFTLKTWNRIYSGETQALREELFLDEGWSHLTENLCGMGISGGNINFANRFFDNTSLYSFCSDEDSAGMRGAILLFLSWLFWESGGVSWDTANPAALIDQGGISFLRRMAASRLTGLDCISDAYGAPVNRLFNEYLELMNGYRLSNRVYNFKTDPQSGEPVDFFVNMGSGYLGFPKTSSGTSAFSLDPWSFVFFDDFNISNNSLFSLENSKTSGGVYFSWSIPVVSGNT